MNVDAVVQSTQRPKSTVKYVPTGHEIHILACQRPSLEVREAGVLRRVGGAGVSPSELCRWMVSRSLTPHSLNSLLEILSKGSTLGAL